MIAALLSKRVQSWHTCKERHNYRSTASVVRHLRTLVRLGQGRMVAGSVNDVPGICSRLLVIPEHAIVPARMGLQDFAFALVAHVELAAAVEAVARRTDFDAFGCGAGSRAVPVQEFGIGIDLDGDSRTVAEYEVDVAPSSRYCRR